MSTLAPAARSASGIVSLAMRARGSSTRVAAGLINPLTGKNFQPSWLIEDFHPHAVKFFERLGERFGVKLWHPLPVMRLAETEKEWLKISSKLDLPEVSLVCILDADKEGFLRSESSLIQTAGRAARHVNGEVVLFADLQTKSIQALLSISGNAPRIAASVVIMIGRKRSKQA